MRRIFYKKNKRKIIICLSLCLLSLGILTTFYALGLPPNRTFSYDQKNDSLKEQNGLGIFLEWDIYPNLNKKVFTPDTTPGTGDSVIHSFSVNAEVDYSLNITAYYDLIDEYNFVSNYDSLYPSGGYLLPNGTWLIVDSDGINHYFGIGSDSETLIWNNIPFNIPSINKDLSVAGNTEGKIRIIYIEQIEDDKQYHHLIQCLSSDNWGASWSLTTIKNYSFVPEGFAIRGLSIAEFNGNFTYMWGLYDPSEYQIWAAQENSTSSPSDWFEARELTALENKDCIYPQVFYNRTNGDGTLMVGYNYENNSRTAFNITQLGDGIGSQGTENWEINTKSSPFWNNFTLYFNLLGSRVKPTVYCTKSYETEDFYFIDRSQRIINGSSFNSSVDIGIQKAEWGSDLSNKPIDYFHPEVEGSFDLFAISEPKSFTDTAKNRYGYFYRGILDCATPFQVRGWESATEAYRRIAHIFNGKDENGDSRKAKSYLFGLRVVDNLAGTKLEDQAIIFVDNTPATIDYSTFYNKISPFASFGTNDDFTININTSDQGEVRFILKSEETSISKTNVTDEINPIYASVLCGNGLTNYLFYIESETASSRSLLMSKSTDGGLSWSDPKSIATTSVENEWGKISAKTEGNSVFLWTSNNKFSEDNRDNYLFFSSDGGDSFIKYNQGSDTIQRAVQAVTDDLISWDSYWDNFTSTFSINKSSDYGFNWEPYLDLSLPNYNDEDECSYVYDLKDVVYDSNTNNYTFIISNNTIGGESSVSKPLLSLNVRNNASHYLLNNIDISDITINADFLSSESQLRYFNIEKYKIDENNSGKILFTVNQSQSQYELIYCTSIDGINFSNWSKYTELNNETIISLNPPIWDILLLNGKSPCFSKVISNFDQISCITKSNFKTGLSSKIGSELSGDITFNGVNNKGEILEDGSYDWELIFADQAGYEQYHNGNLTIDNTTPSLNTTDIISTPEDPYSHLNHNISALIYDNNPDTGMIYYRTNLESEWTIMTMNRTTDIESSLTNFTAFIPAVISDQFITIFYYLEINDTSGNTLRLDRNGQLYSYNPEIRIEEEINPPEEIDLSEDSTLELSFSIPEGIQYINYVCIEFEFDDGNGLQRQNLTQDGSLYRFNITSFSREVTHFKYRIIAVDNYGNDYFFNDGETTTINIIPLMPTWDMTTEQQIIIPIIAIIIGLISGVIYTFLSAQKSEDLNQKMLQRKINEDSKKDSRKNLDEKSTKTLIIDSLKEKRSLTIIFAGSIFVICSIIGLITLALGFPEGAMLGFAGAFLSVVFLWILLSNQIVERLYRTKKVNTLGKENILLIGVSCLIFINLLAIFLIGDTVAWWRVRVNQRSYTIGSVVIPRALFTVFSTFLSSILLLTWSTLREVKNNVEEFKKAEINNDNPKLVIERREKAISKTIGNVGKKGIIFIAAIGISIVFASDLGVYATQGILIIIPFAIGAILALFIGSFFLKRRIEDTDLFIYDNLINCPKCGESTPLSSNYCQNCGEQIIIGKKFMDGIECRVCENISSKDSDYCFHCGKELKKMK